MRLRRVKGYRKPADAVVVTRASKEFGNPYTPGDPDNLVDVKLAVDMFRAYALLVLADDPAWLDPLRGRPLACYCREDWPCHADVLLELANRDDR